MNAVNKTILAAVSWYSRNSPLGFGKSPLQQMALRVAGPIEVLATSRQGGRFHLKFPDDRNYESLLFQGLFEPGTCDLIRRILRPDDVAFDVGANLGCYTVLMAGIVKGGACHAFEPSRALFDRLRLNCQANDLGPNLVLNQLAVGERDGEAWLHTFSGLGHGHSSLSALGRSDFTRTAIRVVSLDSYVREHAVDRVDFIKVDVEGAERSVLRGASSLFERDPPPLWLLEVNAETSSRFGYTPAELLHGLRDRGPYSFYRIIGGWGEVRRVRTVDECRQADNVLCVPENRTYCFQHLPAPA